MRMLTLFLATFGILNAADAPPLDRVLARSGRAVEAFWNDLLAVTCHESISQLKLTSNGKIEAHKDSTFDYLIVARLTPDDLSIQESRVPVAAPAKKGKDHAKLVAEGPPLLVTSGFATLLLVLHPFYQGSYEYAPPVEDTLDGRPVLRVQFRQVHGARSPSCLRLSGRDYPLEWAGSIWLEPGSGTVLRITAELATSMEDVGLRSLSADVRYAAVPFRNTGRLWLPDTATIEASTPKQHWKNVHHFRDYRRFSVETTTTAEAPR